MSFLQWFTDPTNWLGSGGIPSQVGFQLAFSLVAIVIALIIAFPLGVYSGHTGRGEALLMGGANAARALPTLGFLILMVMLLAPRIPNKLAYIIPSLIVLVALALPPLIAATIVGIQGVDRSVIDAARGMGYTPRDVIWKVEVPCAMPSLVAGLRSATLQVVATATVVSYVSLPGLGRYILDGRATGNYAEMTAGAVLVAVLALVLEVAFSAASKYLVSPGLSHSTRRRHSDPEPDGTSPEDITMEGILHEYR